MRIPYFIKNGPVPPLRVVNDLTRKGVYDAGMSGRVEWEPFELNQTEHTAVVRELRRRGLDLLESEPPPDVNSHERWMDWRLVNRYGERAGELSELLGLQRKLMNDMHSSEKRGDEENVGRLHLILIDISARISEIMVSKPA